MNITNLKLERPIVFFDLETTGLDFVTDRIIEINMSKIHPSGEIEKFYSLVNPEGKQSSQEAIDKHGITEEKLKDQPVFKDLADTVYHFINECDLGGYNIMRFDIPMLIEEFLRVDILYTIKDINIIDSMVILQKNESRTLEAVYERLFGKKYDDAHGASADTDATIEVFFKQHEIYNLPSTIKEISDATFENKSEMVDSGGKIKKKDGRFILTFGKHDGKYIDELIKTDNQYLQWMLNKGNFTNEFKIYLTKILEYYKNK